MIAGMVTILQKCTVWLEISTVSRPLGLIGSGFACLGCGQPSPAVSHLTASHWRTPSHSQPALGSQKEAGSVTEEYTRLLDVCCCIHLQKCTTGKLLAHICSSSCRFYKFSSSSHRFRHQPLSAMVLVIKPRASCMLGHPTPSLSYSPILRIQIIMEHIYFTATSRFTNLYHCEF